MGNLKNFQLVMVVLFAFGGILGVFVFAGFIDLGGKAVNSGPTGTVVIWGTYPKSTIDVILSPINEKQTFTMKYVAKDKGTYEKDLLEAFATNTGPDLFFVTDDILLDNLTKISITPYDNFPLVNFKNSFAEGGEVFLNSNGILAFPVLIDPLMMYYNRTLLDSNNIVYAPKYWDEFPNLVKIFTKRDLANGNNNFIQHAFALGQFSNINNAKDIIVSMFMQNGNKISNFNNSYYRSVIKIDDNENLINSLAFYLSFSDPLNSNYSWNRSSGNSFDLFSKEELVFYFGFASELASLFEKNPNLNFQVTSLPQIKNSNFKVTRGKVTGIAISKDTKDQNLTRIALNILTTGEFAEQLSFALNIPPARRDILAKQGKDIYTPVFYPSALFAKSFIDKKESSDIFRIMVEEVLSNGSNLNDAIDNLHNRFNLLLLNN